jgi:hypothetical protein
MSESCHDPNVIYGEFTRTSVALRAAIEVHSLALKPSSLGRDSELSEWVLKYYSRLCSKHYAQEC